LIGPGLGREETTGEFIEKLILTTQTQKHGSGRIGFVKSDEAAVKNGTRHLPPLVLDADGLWLLSKIKQWSERLPAQTILTPHPGEMAVLTGLNVEEIQRERREVASTYAKKWDHVVVLKGAFSVIAAPDGRTTTIPVATAALARAGTGDVLSGLIVGLRAQGVEPYESAVVGGWIHAQAGLLAQELIGSSVSVMAGDVLECVSDVMNALQY
jgi:NAD(P)H-hydrate epimerase